MSKQPNPREPQHLLVAFTVKNLHGQSELVFDGIGDVSQQELDSIQCKSYTKSQMANKQGVLQNCRQLPLPPLKQFTPHSSLEHKSIQRSKNKRARSEKTVIKEIEKGVPASRVKASIKKKLSQEAVDILSQGGRDWTDGKLSQVEEWRDGLGVEAQKAPPHMRSKKP